MVSGGWRPGSGRPKIRYGVPGEFTVRVVTALSAAADAVALKKAWNTIEPELEKFQGALMPAGEGEECSEMRGNG